MPVEAYVTLTVIIAAVILFATEKYPPDLIAVSAMVLLALTGVLTPGEALAGFSNTATVTVAAMFALSAAVLKTGVIEAIAPIVSRHLKNHYTRTTGTMMASVGAVSAFVNNTPVVATFIPIVSTAAREAKIAPSKVLMPLSFGAIFGGTCTLIGTSTNLLVSGIAEQNGVESFSIFTLTPFGLVIFAAGTTYMLLLGNRIVPNRSIGEDAEEDFKAEDFITEIHIPEHSTAAGKSIDEAFASVLNDDEEEIEIVQLLRDDDVVEKPDGNFELHKEDRLAVRGDIKRIRKMLDAEDFRISKRLETQQFKDTENVLLEVMVARNSDLEDRTLRDHKFMQRYNANVLAIRRSGKLSRKKIWEIRLKAGDVLLLHTSRRAQQRIRELESKRIAPFFTLSQHVLQPFRKQRFWGVLGVIAAVVTAASLQLVPISIAAITGICVLALGGVLRPREIYKSIDWSVIFLLAAALSFGAAMNNSGLTDSLSAVLFDSVGREYGPVAIVAALYLITWMLTEVMSNNASAALLAPISISIAATMGLDPLPFLVTIAFAGSASFSTPVGYQTNTMVYSAGNYRFTDFTRVGLPLNLILWGLAILCIPVFYPF
ncbi:MAG TPA: SLC13 family permease [Wenzhouxiangellaceae bacterium]|nr:SLC13 family permease [Wenzhouxiangellaceae bacterium]